MYVRHVKYKSRDNIGLSVATVANPFLDHGGSIYDNHYNQGVLNV